MSGSSGLAIAAVLALGAGALIYSRNANAASGDQQGPPTNGEGMHVTGASGTEYVWIDDTQVNSPPGQLFFRVDDAQGPVMQYTQLASDNHRVMVQAFVTGPRLETAAADFQVGLV